MKTKTIEIADIKLADTWNELAHDVAFEKFQKEHPELNDSDDELYLKFNDVVISKYFKFGEYGTIEIVVDQNFNIVGGKIIPIKK